MLAEAILEAGNQPEFYLFFDNFEYEILNFMDKNVMFMWNGVRICLRTLRLVSV